jgi:GAF domain-containing protein
MTPPSRNGMEAEINRAFQERVARLQAGLDALAREIAEPLPGHPVSDSLPDPDAPVPEPGFLSSSVRNLSDCQDQISLLDRLLESAARFFPRACLFVVRDDKAFGWSSVGLPETKEGDPAKGLSASLEPGSILGEAVSLRQPVRQDVSRADLSFLPPPLPGTRFPRRALAAPLVIRERVAALLYADDGGDGRPDSDFDSAEILAQVAALAATNLALRSHPETSTVEAEVTVQLPAQSTAEPAPWAVPASPAEPGAAPVDPLEEDLDLGLSAPALPEPAGSPEIAPDEMALHEDARRFARLLVSEILLYNEDQVIRGRAQRDIYDRLKEEIDRSRQAYAQRVPRSVSSRVDYLHQEMVRALAAGDPTALGLSPEA